MLPRHRQQQKLGQPGPQVALLANGCPLGRTRLATDCARTAIDTCGKKKVWHEIEQFLLDFFVREVGTNFPTPLSLSETSDMPEMYSVGMEP